MEFISKSEQETKALAKRIARRLKRNDCLALVGPFGSGKTVFVKGLAEGLKVGKNNYVCSPSFVILKIYRGRLPIYHFDLYRLSKERDFQDIGLEEFMTTGGVAVIEWAEKIGRLLPSRHLKIKFAVSGPRLRRLRFYSADPRLKRLSEEAIA